MSVPERASTSTRSAATAAPSSAGECVPSTWDDARDGAFFRITAVLFAPTVTLAMSVLLASYDADPSSSVAVGQG